MPDPSTPPSCAAAWQFVLSNEDTVPPSGKITAEPNGAQARLGINSHAWPQALSDGFYSMTLADALRYAASIFETYYWRLIEGSQLGTQLIASKVADLAFNAGVAEAGRILQHACNRVFSGPNLGIDGIIGAETVARVSAIVATDAEALYNAILAQAAGFYEVLQAKHPDIFTPQLEAAWQRRLQIRPPEGAS